MYYEEIFCAKLNIYKGTEEDLKNYKYLLDFDEERDCLDTTNSIANITEDGEYYYIDHIDLNEYYLESFIYEFNQDKKFRDRLEEELEYYERKLSLEDPKKVYGPAYPIEFYIVAYIWGADYYSINGHEYDEGCNILGFLKDFKELIYNKRKNESIKNRQL